MRYVIGLGLIGIGVALGHEWMIREFKDGWQQVCYQAPHRALGTRQWEGLREAQVISGVHGWQPTVEWVNEQCRALGIK